MRHAIRTIRLAGPLTGVALAVLVGVTPVLAAPIPTTTQAAPGRSAELNARRFCAREWAAARTGPTVEQLQAVGLCEIDRRLVTIDRLGDVATNSRALTEAHQAALETILRTSAAGLRSLRADIAADTAVAELRADIKRIVEDFRIYALVTPQVRLVRAADTVEAAGAALAKAAGRLDGLIDRAEAKGKDVTEAQAHLGTMEAAIDEASAGVDGVADEVLVLMPAGWNAGTAGPVLREAREAIGAARADLGTAKAEARQVVAALR